MIRARYLVLALGLAMLLPAACWLAQKVDMHFVTPVDGQKVTPGVIPIKVHATSDGKILSVTFEVDNVVTAYDTVGANDTWRFSWDASHVSPGTAHELSVFADVAHPNGVTGDVARIHVKVDTGGPWVKMLSPQDGDSVSRGLVPVAVRARDSVGVGMDKVEFYIDDVLGGTVTASAGDTYRWTWNDSQATAGGHSLKAKAYNQHGDKAVAGVTVYVKAGAHGAPKHHYGTISADETWSPDNNPHFIDGDVFITNNALVTIMPGCTVKFTGQYGIRAGTYPPLQGGINAVGLQNSPILFTSAGSSPQPGDWTAIYLDAGTSSNTHFSYCTFEYGGYYSGEGDIIVTGNQAASFDNCTIRHSRYVGIYCSSAAFSSFSNNTITANGSYPIAVSPDVVPTISPDNDLSGNGASGIELLPGSVKTNVTWPAPSVPYVISSAISVNDSTHHPVLTIAPGCSLKFSGGSLSAYKGDIVADGTAGQIVFTTNGSPPAWGKFYGITVGTGLPGDTLSGTRLVKCLVSYGGDSTSGLSGNIKVMSTRPTISNCEIDHGCRCGIVLFGNQVPDTAALRTNNSFANNDSGNVRWSGHK
ncbi:MAG TPA: Ig-like domain-containing protein [bacterium]|nr:Ig-like domain-containing protein [bacterium]